MSASPPGAIVPFFGQGMNCGFEDFRVLDELMDSRGDGDWEALLEEYSALRKPNADAIADMALDNFVEMRDRVGDARFLLAKAVEHRLEEELPTTYRSRYSMVMYGSHIPYRLAQEAGERQRALIDELCSGTNPSEGIAIFNMVVSLLPRLRPQVFVTTHFLDAARRLEEEGKVARLEFLQVELDEDEEPTYQFVPGVAPTSLAQNVASRLGVTHEELEALVEAQEAKLLERSGPKALPPPSEEDASLDAAG